MIKSTAMPWQNAGRRWKSGRIKPGAKTGTALSTAPLAFTQKVTSICREEASHIVAELKRRGQADQPYHRLRFDEQGSTVERTSMFQGIYENIWNTLWQSINEEN